MILKERRIGTNELGGAQNMKRVFGFVEVYRIFHNCRTHALENTDLPFAELPYLRIDIGDPRSGENKTRRGGLA